MTKIINLDEYRQKRTLEPMKKSLIQPRTDDSIAPVIYLPGALTCYRPADEKTSELLSYIYAVK